MQIGSNAIHTHFYRKQKVGTGTAIELADAGSDKKGPAEIHSASPKGQTVNYFELEIIASAMLPNGQKLPARS